MAFPSATSLLRRVALQHRVAPVSSAASSSLSAHSLPSSPALWRTAFGNSASSTNAFGAVTAGQQQPRRWVTTKRRTRVHDLMHHIDQIDKKFNLNTDNPGMPPGKPSKNTDEIMNNMGNAYEEWRAKVCFVFPPPPSTSPLRDSCSTNSAVDIDLCAEKCTEGPES